jgi:hypothetical protein
MKPMGESIAGAANAPAPEASCAVPATPLVSATVLDAPPGYEILREIGQGGMGVVYLARDCALDRPVALKFLQQCFASDPRAGSRFLDEAQITGRLQHPGIPPVHQVGTLPDGRPFLAMKLIRGRTLKQLLREQGPGEARWLGVFEAICQAVGYAHSQNVIHRDLKPANIMVGPFGEVQVMDWGLAKVLATSVAPVQMPDETGPEALWSLQHGQSPRTPVDQTRAGSVLGTPAFMAPEQAIGAIDRLDRRSDVFSLGAILCALLTGQPPFVAADTEATRQLAARAKLDDAFARLDGCGAKPELIALARRCLSAEQDHRPADAGVLAGAVADLRRQAEERARQAELARAGAVVQANEQRKRRRLLLVAAGVVIAVLLCGVVGTTFGLIRAEQARREEVREKEQATKERGEVEEARDQARQRTRLALDAFNLMVFDVQHKLENRPGTRELRQDLLRNARQGLRQLLREAQRQGNPDSTLVWAHFAMGDVELLLGNTQTARKQYEEAHELARRLAEADPQNAQAQRALSVSFTKLGEVRRQLGKTSQAVE